MRPVENAREYWPSEYFFEEGVAPNDFAGVGRDRPAVAVCPHQRVYATTCPPQAVAHAVRDPHQPTPDACAVMLWKDGQAFDDELFSLWVESIGNVEAKADGAPVWVEGGEDHFRLDH